MGDSFHLRGLKLIRARVPLEFYEFELLQYLIKCAESGIYWDQLYRLDEYRRSLIWRIVTKCRDLGLEAELEKLKEEINDKEPVL